jgi:hypothetical protein
MKLIRELEEMVEEEISDIKKYAKAAAKLKSEHPALAQVLYTISTQEDSHQAMIHGEIVKVIDEYRRKHGAPPEAMQAVYDFMHQRHIEDMAEAKRYQEIYKNS